MNVKRLGATHFQHIQTIIYHGHAFHARQPKWVDLIVQPRISPRLVGVVLQFNQTLLRDECHIINIFPYNCGDKLDKQYNNESNYSLLLIRIFIYIYIHI